MQVFQALADPLRRSILQALTRREHTVGQLAVLLRVSQPRASKHLKTLREAGLVIARADGQRRWYRLCAEPFADLEAWLSQTAGTSIGPKSGTRAVPRPASRVSPQSRREPRVREGGR
ncbi:ArsR/SmtB family transcription factor [Salininema proteolyticum]|uniref:ArsR/SmtB family transcription factor n=1 Tax=Salininema proteolyticum TaxID=1607685 RepID=A0ABV8U0X5_9ACTN